MQCCYGGENFQLVLKIVESCGKLGILIYFVFNSVLQIAWTSGLQKENGHITSNWQQPMTSPARDVIGLVIDDAAEAADGERGNPSYARSHYLEGIPQ